MNLSQRTQRIALAIIFVLALLLRCKGITNPIIDHPGWRQGDEAAIARNFARADGNILHPQADYNGPGPNYVELELQIVPYLSSLAYRVVGVHEIIGRLISIAASLGTVAVLFCFGRWLFWSPLAGLAAALLYAIAPGAVYYGRTFQPDTTMALFFTWALFIGTRTIVEEEDNDVLGTLVTTLLTTAAILAKSVAIILYIPLFAVSVAHFGWKATLLRLKTWIILLGSFLPFFWYSLYEHNRAVWKWSSGITTLHVLPSLTQALLSPAAMAVKLNGANDALMMLAHSMLGPAIFGLMILAFLAPISSRANVLPVAWLGAGLVYLFVVVTVEKVDYYLYPFVPLAALVGGAYLGAGIGSTRWSELTPQVRNVAIGSLCFALLVTIAENRREIADYYEYHDGVRQQALYLRKHLAPHTLIVVGHDDPSTLYYLNRRGWIEDAYLWTPFDEQSAIAKGARYFIVVEPDRLKRNIELSAWLQRFPTLATPPNVWRVYVTDPHHLVPGAEAAWRKFRARERAAAKRRHHHRIVHKHARRGLETISPVAEPTSIDGTTSVDGTTEATAAPDNESETTTPVESQTESHAHDETVQHPAHRVLTAPEEGLPTVKAVPLPLTSAVSHHAAAHKPSSTLQPQGSSGDDSQLDQGTLEPGAKTLEHL